MAWQALLGLSVRRKSLSEDVKTGPVPQRYIGFTCRKVVLAGKQVGYFHRRFHKPHPHRKSCAGTGTGGFRLGYTVHVYLV